MQGLTTSPKESKAVALSPNETKPLIETKESKPNFPIFDKAISDNIEQAIEEGNVDCITAFIDAGADVTAKTTQGNTLLLALTTATLIAGAPSEEEDEEEEDEEENEGNENLEIENITALTKNFTTYVYKLLGAKADINAVDAQGNNALHLVVNFKSGYAGTEIQKLVLEVLIKAGINKDATNTQSGSTALLLATTTSQFNLVKILVRKKANIHLPNHNGQTPLHGAIYGSFMLKETSDGSGSPHWQEITQYLIEKKASLNEVDNKGNTPAHYMNSNYSSAILRQLLKHKADINRPNDQGITLFHIAASRGLDSFKTALEAKNANPFQADQRGITPIIYALAMINYKSKFPQGHDQKENEKFLSLLHSTNEEAIRPLLMKDNLLPTVLATIIIEYAQQDFCEISWLTKEESVAEAGSVPSTYNPLYYFNNKIEKFFALICDPYQKPEKNLSIEPTSSSTTTHDSVGSNPIQKNSR